jgi:hypothetical protein
MGKTEGCESKAKTKAYNVILFTCLHINSVVVELIIVFERLS